MPEVERPARGKPRRKRAERPPLTPEEEIILLYGNELNKAKTRISRWRVSQVKEAFQIGDLWSELIQKHSPAEVTAFLVAECQVPSRDVQRYVRLAATLGEQRQFYIDAGVAVSVLLDLADRTNWFAPKPRA